MAFALVPEAPLDSWLVHLDRWTERSPNFFAGRPVVLDLGALNPPASEIGGVVEKLLARNIRIYAIQADGVDMLPPELPPLLKGAREATAAEERTERRRKGKAKPEIVAPPGSLIIRAPVRSGQSIFQPQGDVIVIGAVGSGSEIIAGGSVHIYGTLRGRVFAGATGNADARIFCRKNEAELLAVDGCYRTADDMEPDSRGKPIQAFLENGTIHVAAIN